MIRQVHKTVQEEEYGVYLMCINNEWKYKGYSVYVEFIRVLIEIKWMEPVMELQDLDEMLWPVLRDTS